MKTFLITVCLDIMFAKNTGSSEGEPSEDGLNLDADAVLEFAVQHPK